MWTVPSSSTLICAPVSSWILRIDAALADDVADLLGGILMVMMRGANSRELLARSWMASIILPRMNARPSWACMSALRRMIDA